MPDENYEGWSNSATFLAAMYLRQDSSIYSKVVDHLKRSALNERTMAAIAGKVEISKSDNDDSVGLNGTALRLNHWAEGQVNWQEIVENYQIDLGIVPEPVSNDLQKLMAEVIIEGSVVRLGRKLDRAPYLKFDEAMQAIGGKWTTKANGHVFDEDPSDLIEAIIETGTFERPQKADNFGFFPTPAELVREMLLLAGITPGARIFEPNAGDGAIAELAAELVGHGNVVTLELQERNAATLRAKGFEPIVGDFLAYDTTERFPFILMNPPFAKQADIDHVMHAWRFLAAGGRLVAIMAASVSFRDNAKTREFRAFLESHGGEIRENPDGSFKSSGTGVRTVTVVVDKPAAVTAMPVVSTPSFQNIWLDEDEALAA